MKISYIFPSRTRNTKFFNCLDIIECFSESKDYEVICALDEDDLEMNNEETIRKIAEYENVKAYYGNSTSKINACNREISKISKDTSIIVLQSDDMRWLNYGFDTEIREAFKTHFPNFDGVVHFPDSHALDRTMTLTIMGINLFKELGYLYHPSFDSVYADNHLTEMTKKMGKYVFVDKKIVDHFHPIWNMAAWDEQYRKTEDSKLYQKDKETYLKLKANNFGL